jgi:hypothetical protein
MAAVHLRSSDIVSIFVFPSQRMEVMPTHVEPDGSRHFSNRPTTDQRIERELREINKKLDRLLAAAGLGPEEPKYQKPKRAIVDPVFKSKKR